MKNVKSDDDKSDDDKSDDDKSDNDSSDNDTSDNDSSDNDTSDNDSSDNDTSDNDNSDYDEASLEDLWTAMGRVLSLVRERRDAWPFRRPVDEEFAPGYLSFIEHPMDLATMNEKLKARVYTGRDQFADDLHLIFDNCRKYNGPNSDYTALANKLEKFVNQCIGKYLPVEEEESSSSSEGSSASSDDDDRYEHYKDDSDRAHYQPSQYIQTQTAWTSSLYRTSTSSLSVPSPSSLSVPSPSSSQVRRPCYATPCSPRKTSLLKGASTIITIRRIPDSTPPTKFYASGNISHSGQHPVSNLTGLAGGESKDQYQIVAVPAAGFITDVACTAIPTTATQNTVQQHPQVNQNRLVTTDVVTVESVSQSHPVTVRTYGQVANTVIVTSTHAASVSTKPVSLLTHGLTTQTLQQTTQTRPVVSCVAVGRGSPAGANFQRRAGHSVGKQRGVAGIGTTLGSSPGPRLVVTSVPSPRRIVTSVPSPRLVVNSVPSPRLVVNSVTSDSRLSPATHELTDSCQYMKSTDCLQLSPSVLPQLGVNPGHSPKSLVDHGQQKLLVNGQISNTGCRTSLTTNGQLQPKLLDESVVPQVQCLKPDGQIAVTQTLGNTSTRVSTAVSSSIS
ncbi:hypothetical protein LSAT2_005970 [Lamellibrachia satsuma]|nr:hypothetical protein LSAT2_005970 [Lamellibrachia satsuma]